METTAEHVGRLAWEVIWNQMALAVGLPTTPRLHPALRVALGETYRGIIQDRGFLEREMVKLGQCGYGSPVTMGRGLVALALVSAYTLLNGGD